MPRNYNPMPLWKSFLISSALHATLFTTLYFLHTPHYKRIENKKENYVTIKLRHEPIAFNQQVQLGKDTTSINPTSSLEHKYKKEEKTIPKDSLESITKRDDITKPDMLSSILDKMDKDLDQLIKMKQEDIKDFQDLTKTASEIDKKLKNIEKDISQTFGQLNQQLELLLLVLDNKSIQEYFNHTYKLGERNEISYSELWRAYANAYLFLNGKIGKILPILRENKNIEDILSIDVIFEKDGTFRFEKIKMSPDFKDKENKVYNHYESIFEQMPKKFISPLECNLPVPYRASYTATNREKYYNDEGKSISLEKLVK